MVVFGTGTTVKQPDSRKQEMNFGKTKSKQIKKGTPPIIKNLLIRVGKFPLFGNAN
jgi:hypothetical protein